MLSRWKRGVFTPAGERQLSRERERTDTPPFEVLRNGTLRDSSPPVVALSRNTPCDRVAALTKHLMADPAGALVTPWTPSILWRPHGPRCATPSPGSRNNQSHGRRPGRRSQKTINPMDVGIHETTPWRGSLQNKAHGASDDAETDG